MQGKRGLLEDDAAARLQNEHWNSKTPGSVSDSFSVTEAPMSSTENSAGHTSLLCFCTPDRGSRISQGHVTTSVTPQNNQL